MPESLEKLPPQNIEAEKSVLGSLLIDKEAMIRVADLLTPKDFYKETHSEIFETMLELFEKREPIDVLSVASKLQEKKQLEEIGGRSYLISLANLVPTAAHVEYYAKIVQKKSTLRKLIHAATEITELGYKETEDTIKVLDKAEQKLFNVSQKFLKTSIIPIKDILVETFERIDELHRESGKLRGIPTGFGDLDNILAGLQKSDLVILAARPSMGKTSLALDIARHIAIDEKIPTGIFSLEMSKEQVVDRLLCAQANIDLWRMRTGKLSSNPENDEFERIGYAIGQLSEAPIYIDDSPMSNVMEIRTKARRLQMERNLGFLIVDYLQLIEGHGYSDNRVQEVSDISRSLKGIARELNIPVLALSQLSRAVESRPGNIPQLADLRESGCLDGKTLITNIETGKKISIKELTQKQQKDFKVLSVNSNNNLISVNLIKTFYSGKKMTFELITESGRTIKASANHKFLKSDGWARLDTLKQNDRIAVPHVTKIDLKKLLWDKIISIKPMGIKDVYDATIANTHNFAANDIIVHNSIEQDSDVVMFIYREEMYKKDTDKQNVAEIYIRKHRNGPTGVINLYFDHEKVSFKNLEKKHEV